MSIPTPTYHIASPALGQAAICAPILKALPDWFGVESALRQYILDIDNLPTLLALQTPLNYPLGFLSLKTHTPSAAEIYVMGVLPELRGRGIGRALVQAGIAHLRAQGIEYLQVKTLGPSREDASYAATRAFYQSLGFCPLEEFKQIWDADNPCLIMVQRL